jgi:hypothetical protein
MPQLKKSYTEITVPFTKMSFTPDVPSSVLGANEYNVGENVETDVRGIRSVSGEEEILGTVPGIPTYISGGFRGDGKFYFIVATEDGYWYMNDGISGWTDITPSAANGYTHTGYGQAINITEAWNGTVAIFNDTVNPPFFLPATGDKLVMYKNNLLPQSMGTVTTGTSTVTVTVATDYGQTVGSAPFGAGDQILITNVNNYWNGIYTVVSSNVDSTTQTTIVYSAVPGAAWPGSGTISAAYTWNYKPNWKSLTAAFMRIYSTPNVGNILVAGNFTANVLTPFVGSTNSGTPTVTTTAANAAMVGKTVSGAGIPADTTCIGYTAGVSITLDKNATATATNITLNTEGLEHYPITVAWSQNFGLNQVPLTWQPTILGVANQLEVPLRGAVIDAFPSNGQLFLSSYWDTVVFTPMNYATTSAPILGVRLFNQGRGMLTSNCWANTDEMVYGIDARDIWVFDGRTFNGIGNQKVKNWFFDQIDQNYVDRIYVETNTAKNQVEIYYPDHNVAKSGESEGVPNKMISYRYDLDVWNPPRDVSKATFACESPVWSDTHYYEELSPTTTTGVGSGATVTIKRKGATYSVYLVVNPGQDYAVGDTLTIAGDQLGGATPANDCVLTVTDIQTGGGLVAADASGTAEFNWVYNKASRGIVYAKGATGKKLIQKDQGYRFVDDQVINSLFRRDNIKLSQDYSTKTLVHRVLPAIVNLKEDNAPINPAVDTSLIGNVYATVEGANSVGQAAQSVISYSIATNTDNPWIQIDQNAHRVNSIEMTNDITTPDTIWMCNAVVFQFTETEDDR